MSAGFDQAGTGIAGDVLDQAADCRCTATGNPWLMATVQRARCRMTEGREGQLRQPRGSTSQPVRR